MNMNKVIENKIISPEGTQCASPFLLDILHFHVPTITTMLCWPFHGQAPSLLVKENHSWLSDLWFSFLGPHYKITNNQLHKDRSTSLGY